MNASVLTRFTANRPTVSQLWSTLQRLPGGKELFSKTIGWMAPYTATISARVLTLSEGHAEVLLRDRRAVRNHLDCVHAIALLNLGEVATGLAVLYSVDGRGRGIIRSLKMDYLKKARGDITATCDVNVPVRKGSYDAEIVGDLRNTDGEVVARAYATWKITID